MCGILGIINIENQRPIGAELLGAMSETMVHRGPDGAGVWVQADGQCGLAHRRLAIVDLSSYYDSNNGGAPKIVATVFKDERVQRFSGKELHYPLDIMPDLAEPPIYWVGPLACVVLEQPNLAIANLREKAEEGRKLLEKRRAEDRLKRGLQ